MSPTYFSDLKQFARSPAHYRHAVDHPTEATRGMRVGTAVHHRVLGGRRDRAVVVFPGDSRRGKDWTAFQALHARPDRRAVDILTQPEWDDSEGPATAVLTDPVAQTLLHCAEYEVPLEWDDAGMRCQTRGVDVVGPDYIAELKVTNSAEPEKFGRLALGMFYHAQLAFYLGGCVATGRNVQLAYIIAVEAAPPHAVTVLKLAPDVLAAGAKLCSAWMERLRVCEASNQWPGYAQSPVEWTLPEWMTPSVEMEDE